MKNKSYYIIFSTIAFVFTTLAIWEFRPEISSIQDIQYTDIAGIGDILSYNSRDIKIGNITYWRGSYPTNEIIVETLGNITYGNNPEIDFYPVPGRKAVFFLMTNEWKQSSLGVSVYDYYRLKVGWYLNQTNQIPEIEIPSLYFYGD